MSVQQKVQPCGRCNAEIPVNPGYVTWCDQCGWNIDPYENMSKKDIRARFNRRIGKSINQKLLNTMLHTFMEERSTSLLRIMAALYAGLVYAGVAVILLTCLLGGIYLLYRGATAYYLYERANLIYGGLGLYMVYVMLPKRLSNHEDYLDAEQFPVLYSVVNRISDELGASRIERIVINEEYNASIRTPFFKKGHILTLGLPLFYVLNRQEKVALIAHELAHDVNRDVARGRFIGGAVAILAHSYIVLRPGLSNSEDAAYALFTMLMVVLAPVRWLCSWLVLLLLYGLCLMVWRDSQKSEYLADQLACSISGTKAMSTLLDKLHFNTTFISILKMLKKYGYSKEVLSEFAHKITMVPEREVERLRRLQFEYLSSVDSTHPPTVYRKQFIEHYMQFEQRQWITEKEEREIVMELQEWKTRIEARLLVNIS